MSDYINEPLYKALLHACSKGVLFGGLAGSVKVVQRGQPNQGYYENLPTGRRRLKLQRNGEAYLVCCPWCGDTRGRLSINHAWGVFDEQTQTKNRFLVHCFNEECQEQPGFFDDLLPRINVDGLRIGGRAVQLPELKAPTSRPAPAALPQSLVPLQQLASGHPAKVFLSHRRGGPHDPVQLEEQWGVAYCDYDRNTNVRGRLIFPIWMYGEIVGWQARYLGEDGSGNPQGLYLCRGCWEVQRYVVKPRICEICQGNELAPVPKWQTSAGVMKSELLYNFDRASTWPFVVLMEGPFDPIRLGSPTMADAAGPGIATFGHSLSARQKVLIWSNLNWRNGVLYLAYDDDAWDDNCQLFTELKDRFSWVIPVPFPVAADPGDLPHSELWDCLRQATIAAGAPILF